MKVKTGLNSVFATCLFLRRRGEISSTLVSFGPCSCRFPLDPCQKVERCFPTAIGHNDFFE